MRTLLCIRAFCAFLLCAGSLSVLHAQQFYWPTPDRAFHEGHSYDKFITPTLPDKPYSGLFGCVRNNGRKFHEGIDLRATMFDKRGEATDPIYATMDGTIVHINAVAGNSSYGRYIVIEHRGTTPAIYSLYSHLRFIDASISVGKEVKGGDVIGVMGRSAAGYTIPKHRAHLHFELGFRVSR